jgi:hypothetical protein
MGWAHAIGRATKRETSSANCTAIDLGATSQKSVCGAGEGKSCEGEWQHRVLDAGRERAMKMVRAAVMAPT